MNDSDRFELLAVSPEESGAGHLKKETENISTTVSNKKKNGGCDNNLV